MDLDGDGVISMYEMEYFYDEQMQKMESLGIEKLPFEDCLCQVNNISLWLLHSHFLNFKHVHVISFILIKIKLIKLSE